MVSGSAPKSHCPPILAIAAFGLLSLLGGWLIVYGGGFQHAPTVRSTERIVVTGASALLMAALQFLAAALAFGGVFVPPLLVVLG